MFEFLNALTKFCLSKGQFEPTIFEKEIGFVYIHTATAICECRNSFFKFIVVIPILVKLIIQGPKIY